MSEERTKIGRYHVVGHLTSGGMAEILLGKLLGPSGFERPVVIKRILRSLARQEEFRNMFLDEARVVARMKHPNVVQVQELGEEGDDLYMVMEYLEGESVLSLLRRANRRGLRLDPILCAHVAEKACAGLHAAHELTSEEGEPLGLVHRDVSPSNVFITYDGAVKLLDFGIAKFSERSTETEAGQVKGKFSYMSPEQCLAQPLDRRSDLFSLGIVLFELLTGSRLFARETSLLTMKAITEGRIPSPREVDPSVPEPLDRICERALCRDPGDRPSTAADMRRDLLNAIREIGYDGIPEEALGALMQRCFEDRIEEKRELLRRVRSGSAITQVPMAEVDGAVELPAVEGTPHAQAVPAPPPPERASRVPLLAAAAIAVLGLAVGGAAALFAGGDPAAEPAPAMEATPVVSSAPTEVPAPEPDPAPPPMVTLSVHSTPPGAAVTVDGEGRGQTPVELELPRADAPLEIVLSHDGYETLTREVVPSTSTRLEVALPRARRTPRAVKRRPVRPPAPREEGESPFRRFN